VRLWKNVLGIVCLIVITPRVPLLSCCTVARQFSELASGVTTGWCGWQNAQGQCGPTGASSLGN
jgi:hypothetical protein